MKFPSSPHIRLALGLLLTMVLVGCSGGDGRGTSHSNDSPAQGIIEGIFLLGDAEADTSHDGTFVYLEGRDRVAVTDADGRFQLTQVPTGMQTVRAQREGYAPNRIQF